MVNTPDAPEARTNLAGDHAMRPDPDVTNESTFRVPMGEATGGRRDLGYGVDRPYVLAGLAIAASAVAGGVYVASRAIEHFRGDQS